MSCYILIFVIVLCYLFSLTKQWFTLLSKIFMLPNAICTARPLVLCRENGLENVITLVKGKAEEVALPVEKVNLI